MKLPIRPLGLIAAGMLLSTALAPVAAQQNQSGVDGQVALRSDGALYVISNGQRRWVATTVASDDEINALPEGEPIYAGLMPLGAGQQVAANPQPKPATSASPAPAAAAPAAAAGSTAAKPAASTGPAAPASTPDPNLSTDVPVEVDIDGSNRVEQGEERRVEIKTRKDVTCELIIRLPDGKELAEDSKNADSSGRCRFNIQLPDDAAEGDGLLIGSAREGGKVNTAELRIRVIEK
jgi:hypothetical protein